MSSSKRTRGLVLWSLVLSLGFGASSAIAASSEVNFVKPEGFADAGRGELDREQALAELKSHLQRAAAQMLPAEQRLQLDVTQVNLAGEMEPMFRRGTQDVRVMRNASWPSMELHYKLSDASGATLKEGDARLAELDYLQRSNVRYAGQALAHEKAMIDRWFQAEFRVEQKPAGK